MPAEGDGGRTSTSTGGQAGASDGASTNTSTEPCIWEGWYRAPRMPEGCTGLCIPDDVQKRVPILTWSARADWCSGCLQLDTPWATTDEEKKDAVGLGVTAYGAEPQMVSLGIIPPDGGYSALFDGNGMPRGAWRVNANQTIPCGRAFPPRFDSGFVAMEFFHSAVTAPHEFLRVPLDRASDLMTSTENTFVWSTDFTRGRGINDLWFSDSMVAADFSGSIGLGDFDTGEAVEINETATGLSGSYNEAQLVGKTAFVSRYNGYRTEWFVVENGQARLFRGDEQHDIDFLVTDGETIIYKEGVEPYTNPDGAVPPILYTHYDLFSAPYTTDGSTLVPKLLVRDIPAGAYYARLQNGYLVASYLTSIDIREGGAIVVRVSDGRAWNPRLPAGWSWGWYLYPSATELWGAVTRYYAASKFETIARFPYEQMEVAQEAAPAP